MIFLLLSDYSMAIAIDYTNVVRLFLVPAQSFSVGCAGWPLELRCHLPSGPPMLSVSLTMCCLLPGRVSSPARQARTSEAQGWADFWLACTKVPHNLSAEFWLRRRPICPLEV
jgi:hypothetical protein